MSIVPRKKPAPKAESYLEKNVGKQELAKIFVTMEEFDNDNRYDLTNQVLELAGERALANQYYFAVDSDGDGGYYMSGVSKSYWENNKQFNDRTRVLGFAMPCGEVAEMTYSFEDERSLAANVKAMKEAGFMFNEDVQNFISKKLTKEVKALFEGKPAAVFNKNSEKKQQQKPKRPRGGIAGPGGCMSRG